MFCCLRSEGRSSRSKTLGIVAPTQQETIVEAPTSEIPDAIHPPSGDDMRIAALSLRAWELHMRYTEFRDINDLNEAIVLSRDALSISPTGRRDSPRYPYSLAAHLSARHEQLGGTDDLEEAIVLSRQALSLCPPGDHDRLRYLNNLANNLSSRYEQLGTDDLNEAIALSQDALSLCPYGHPDRSMYLSNLAARLNIRYKQFGGIDDLNEAITLGQEALSLCSSEHLDRSALLDNLAVLLSSRYTQLGSIDDLQKAIILSQEALSLHPPGHPDRLMSLNNLAADLASRFKQLGCVDDLDRAIVLGREALSLCPHGNPHYSASLNNLATNLSTRYGQLQDIDDLNEVIFLDQEALSLCPLGHPVRPQSLDNLAVHLSDRFDQLGGIEDLKEAIALGRESLSLRLHGDPDRSKSLGNLACHLSSRHRQLGGIDDIEEAIALHKEVLSLCPPGHPEHLLSLNNLAIDLSSRYTQLREIDDLNDAIVLSRDVVSRCPPGSSKRSVSVNNLATYLISRHKRLGGIDDLKEATTLSREALPLYPPGDRSTPLHNLAIHLFYQYRQLGNIDDLNEAIVLGREALSLCSLGHPGRLGYLNNLARSYYTRFAKLGCGEDKKELFSLYTELEHVSPVVSPYDLAAARSWVEFGEELHHPSILSAYETTLRLLAEHSSALPPLPQHLSLLKALSVSLAVDAFSACLRNKSPTKAVELLEQGRGIFWSQLTRLRSPLDNVITLGPEGNALADEFTRLTSLIRTALHSPGPDQHDRVWQLNPQLKKVVSDIRGLHGLSPFLLPSSFSDLQQVAKEGPVIIVNASKYGCDALFVFVDKDPVHVPLPVTEEEVRGLSSKLYNLRVLATGRRKDKTMDLKCILQELWDRVVSHIVDVLLEMCPRLSRIWWCPTAGFSFLPLHAAAPYRNGQQGVSDLFISSYTTTLTALTHARRPDMLNSKPDEKRFIAIGQAHAPGFTPLPSIHTEVTNVRRHIKAATAFTRVEGKDAHISNVTDQLGKNEWVHLACHGVSNQERPFDSAFALRDGLFTIQRIIQCHMENPEFAYLSACHTTVGDWEDPDEVIHLASAMQFSGFRSLIGTMWSVSDSPATKVASAFYKFMVDEAGCLDHTRAAWALWNTLKTVDIPLDQRILYVHLGA